MISGREDEPPSDFSEVELVAGLPGDGVAAPPGELPPAPKGTMVGMVLGPELLGPAALA